MAASRPARRVASRFGPSAARGGCDPASSLFAAGRPIVAGESHLLAGVASDEVARVEVIGTRGVAHRVAPSADHGFIYDC